MKKLFAVILSLMLLTGAAMAEDFQSMTGLDRMQEKLDVCFICLTVQMPV